MLNGFLQHRKAATISSVSKEKAIVQTQLKEILRKKNILNFQGISSFYTGNIYPYTKATFEKNLLLLAHLPRGSYSSAQ